MLSVSKQKTKAASDSVSVRPQRRRILISDDQHDILTALSLLLKLSNFSAETVDSPSYAIEAARSGNMAV